MTREQLFTRIPPLVPVPRLSEREWRAVGLIEGGWPGVLGSVRISSRVLRSLIRQRCVEVMAMSPAQYRVTKLGKVARSLGVRS